jgi:hypothetical protein
MGPEMVPEQPEVHNVQARHNPKFAVIAVSQATVLNSPRYYVLPVRTHTPDFDGHAVLNE